MKRNKFSIIIPVFNIEKYIKQSIESILCQNYDNYELLLIDDGSQDDSGLICDEYAKKYKRIKVIHKENGGLSDARNFGIKVSSGNYLMFVDGDDFVSNINVLKEINESLNQFNNPDILQYKMMYYYEKGDKYVELPNIDVSNFEYNKYLYNNVKKGTLSVSACDKIIKRDLIIDSNIYFEKGLLSEDIDWSFRVYLKAKSICGININIYVYRQQREGSITSEKSIKRINSLFLIIEKWAKDKPNNNIDLIINNYLAYQYLILLTIINHKNCKKNLKLKIMNYRWLLKYRLNYKTNLSMKIMDVFGIGFGRTILKIYLYLKEKRIIKL